MLAHFLPLFFLLWVLYIIVTIVIILTDLASIQTSAGKSFPMPTELELQFVFPFQQQWSPTYKGTLFYYTQQMRDEIIR